MMIPIYGFLSSVFSYAVDRKAIPENPCEGVILPKIEKEEHAVLTIEQAVLLLKTLKEHADPKYYIFFLLAIYTGARRGEVIALRWSDIDFDQNIIRITRTLKHSKGLDERRAVKQDRPQGHSQKALLYAGSGGRRLR
ncbi:MAG: tyrosine-type recombinase/integrase [Ruminococcus sp.]|nr:tyrosine-type recombinase/integrase [Ruminococcus sp.]